MIMDKKLCAACAALAVFALAMTLPQGSALAKGMDVKTSDLLPVGTVPPESGGIGTASAVTDNRTRLIGGNRDPWTAWGLSVTGMEPTTPYVEMNHAVEAGDCSGHLIMTILTDGSGNFSTSLGVVADDGRGIDVREVVDICRSDGDRGLIAILSGVLEGGGRNNSSKKKNR